MDWWTIDLGVAGGVGFGRIVAVVAACAIAIVFIAAAVTKIRYGGVLKEVRRSALLWTVIGCDVGPVFHHKSSLIYWRVGGWRIGGRPDLLLKHRFLPIIEILEIKSRAKSQPSPYEFLQVQIYLSAAGQAFPWFFRKAYVVYPGKFVKVRRSRRALGFLKWVLSDVKSHLANGLSARDQRALKEQIAKSTN